MQGSSSSLGAGGVAVLAQAGPNMHMASDDLPACQEAHRPQSTWSHTSSLLQGANRTFVQGWTTLPHRQRFSLGPKVLVHEAKDPQGSSLGPRWGSQVEHGACQAHSIPVQCVDVFYVPKESADLFWL